MTEHLSNCNNRMLLHDTPLNLTNKRHNIICLLEDLNRFFTFDPLNVLQGQRFIFLCALHCGETVHHNLNTNFFEILRVGVRLD